MKRRIKGIKLIIIALLFLNLVFVGALVSKELWVSKVNGEKLSYSEFMDYYKGFLHFQVMGSPLPISKAQLAKIGENKEQIRAFLRSYEDETLLIKKAKEQKTYSKKEIDRRVRLISKVIRNKLVVKSLLDKYIYPKVSASKREISRAYSSEMSKTESPYKGIPKKNALSAIKERIKASKALEKLKSYTGKLRLESEIIHNPSVVK